MMPPEMQLQTASQSVAVMIRAVGKLPIWKQKGQGCREAVPGEPRLAAAKDLTDPPPQRLLSPTC